MRRSRTCVISGRLNLHSTVLLAAKSNEQEAAGPSSQRIFKRSRSPASDGR